MNMPKVHQQMHRLNVIMNNNMQIFLYTVSETSQTSQVDHNFRPWDHDPMVYRQYAWPVRESTKVNATNIQQQC